MDQVTPTQISTTPSTSTSPFSLRIFVFFGVVFVVALILIVVAIATTPSIRDSLGIFGNDSAKTTSANSNGGANTPQQDTALSEAYIVEKITHPKYTPIRTNLYSVGNERTAVKYVYADIISKADYDSIKQQVDAFLAAEEYVWTYRSPDTPKPAETYTDSYQRGEYFFDITLTPSTDLPAISVLFIVPTSLTIPQPSTSSSSTTSLSSSTSSTSTPAASEQDKILAGVSHPMQKPVFVRSFDPGTNRTAYVYVYQDIPTSNRYTEIRLQIENFLKLNGYVWTSRTPDSPKPAETYKDLYQKGNNFFELELTPSTDIPAISFVFTTSK